MSIQYEMREFATSADLKDNYKVVRARINQPTRFGPEPSPIPKTGRELPTASPPSSPPAPAPMPAAIDTEQLSRLTVQLEQTRARAEKLEQEIEREERRIKAMAARGDLVPLIVRLVAQYFQVPPAALVGTCKTAPIVWPRQIAMYLAREKSKLSMPQLGKFLGGRDHTTILHGYRKVCGKIAAGDEKTIEALDAIHARLIELRPDLDTGPRRPEQTEGKQGPSKG